MLVLLLLAKMQRGKDLINKVILAFIMTTLFIVIGIELFSLIGCLNTIVWRIYWLCLNVCLLVMGIRCDNASRIKIDRYKVVGFLYF